MAVNVRLTWINASTAMTGQRIECSKDGGVTFELVAMIGDVEREHIHAPALSVAGEVQYRIVSYGATGVEAVSEILSVLDVPADGDVVPPTNLQGEIFVE